MVGLANEALEPENTSDELSAIKYNTKEAICKPLFRFFVTKKYTKSRDLSISALRFHFLLLNYSKTGREKMGQSPVWAIAPSAAVAVILALMTANFLSVSHTLSSLASAAFAFASHRGQPSNT